MSRLSREVPITCDDCGEQFKRNIDEFPLANGGVRQALVCPHCERYYPICAISPLGVRYRKRLYRMRLMLKRQNALPGEEYHDLLARYRAQVTQLGSDERRERAVDQARQTSTSL